MSPELEQTIKKQRLIQSLVNDRSENLKKYTESEDFKPQSFMVPAEIFKFLIPQKALSMAENPENLEILLVNQDESQLKLFLVERNCSKPLSDPEEFDKYLRLCGEKEIEVHKSGQLCYIPPEAPKTIDELHALYSQFIIDGMIGLNDRIYSILDLHKDQAMNDVVISNSYTDNKTIRGKGVTREFFENLRTFLKSLQFKYIVGFNSERNLGFFKDKLNRKLFKELTPQQEKYFLDNDLDCDQYTTFDIL